MTAAQPQASGGELYVHRIDELREEIRRAMAAVSGNRLRALEESLWRQEVLCTGLKHMIGSVGETAPLSKVAKTAETTAGSASGDTLNLRLQASLTALHQLNRSYAELLRQAQASNHLLYTLCLSYGHNGREPTVSSGQHCSLEA